MSGEHTLKAVRGSFIDVTRTVYNPEEIASALRFIEDGLLLIKQGKVEWFGEWENGKHQIPDTIRVRDYRGKLIVPGFVDTHIHYPQSEMVGAYGEQLLEWLNKHTFPTERRYEDLEYAREMSAFFIKQLLRNGTTTALVFGTVHPQSVDALFEAASHINMRMIAGKVMMDRNAPDYLLDTAESSYHQSKELIERWHKNGRLLYAITPRFAPTSSPEQMAMAQRLKEEYPDTWVHTHLCENKDEIAWVKSLYPDHDGYLDVYHQYGLTGKNCVFAHCVHLEEKEWDRLSETKSSIAFCPTSNLYLGSGLFNLKKAWQKKVKVGMGTDIGAGAAVWHGVQTFCSNFNYTAQQFTAADTSLDAAKAALNSAAQSGAGLVVCYGSEMAAALYDIQDNYPTVNYLMIGDEPHSEDYTDYRTSANVHCVLFREEQAAYLAGYAAVREGNTSMAVLGGEPLPSTVRYATGFVQGAEAAADSMGVQVYIRIWYSSMTASDDDLTDYVCGWYNEGFQVVMAATPELADSCIQAAEKSGREVIATGWDCAGQSSSVITSAVNCYSTVVQNELYLFGTQNNWDQDHSGQTETLGTEVDAVGLATQEWRLKTFTGEEYRELYQRMAAGTVKVERYSDTTAMPQTQNVTVDQPNQ
mgnify:CR=1 FL=1